MIRFKATHSFALNRLLYHRAIVGLAWNPLWDKFANKLSKVD